MKHIHSTTVRFDEETYQLVKHSTETLGISMNQLVSFLLHFHLPLDVSDLACYRYMKLFGRGEENHDDTGRN